MATTTARRLLSTDVVLQRIKAYNSPEMTRELYAFGSMLVQDAQQHMSNLDTKASMVLGYGSAMVTFLLLGARGPVEGFDFSAPFLILGGLFAVAAILISFVALKVTSWKWFSEPIWFPDPALLTDDEHLRRHYVEAMHEIHQLVGERNERKATFLEAGQYLLVTAAVLLFLALDRPFLT